jgi:phosphatidylinositol kinase/protein kinase (PI-3  family)
MGGLNSKNYEEFEILCCKTFNILRRFANYILLYFQMMTKSNIPHISGEFEENIHKVIENNLKLELTDEEANEYIISLIKISLNSIMPTITDKFHTWAQIFKS